MRPSLPRALRAFALIAVLAAAGPAVAQRQWIDDYTRVSRYEIEVAPNAEGGTFTGTVRAHFSNPVEMATLTLNALDMQFSRATIDGRPAAVTFDENAQTATLTPARPIRPGNHRVEIAYSGRIYDEAYGLFRVTYQDERGEQRMLATQFEPGDARRFAPMWDQPNRRAVFQVTVDVPAGQNAVGNMPVERTTRLSGGAQRIRFQPTPSMPSYLLFLAVGDIERISMDVDGVDLGVVTRRGQSERGRVALEYGAESLRWFTQYFGIRYPLPKLDMIAVPGAGGFGAMENWGAILYFDQYLLLDAEASSEADRRNVFGIVAHEIAHQWFGNLVTMAWWDDLWLNEGFASWMAAKAAEALHPNWSPWLDVLTDSTASAMALDSRAGTHPVVQTVNTIDEANLAFDAITYDKGLSVIRMLEAYVGEENWRNGVRAYLNGHLYGNAATVDLWRAIQAASGQPVHEIARSFTRQNGFPLLTASGENCGTSGRVALTQTRFAMDDASRTGERWEIPVMARRVGGETVRA
ncbi:MAG: M1 family metallopeptidase, partial [Hyphomonadaceae bacterium]